MMDQMVVVAVMVETVGMVAMEVAVLEDLL